MMQFFIFKDKVLTKVNFIKFIFNHNEYVIKVGKTGRIIKINGICRVRVPRFHINKYYFTKKKDFI